MKQAIYNGINDWLPPVLVRRLRKIKGQRNCFEGEYDTWQEANTACSGYQDDTILAKVLAATLKVKNGEAAYERDSVLFDKIDYSWPVTAGLMWVAARNKGRLNVLDFGGSLGSSYYQNRKFLRTLPQLNWNVIEQSHYVDAGKQYIQDDQLRFYKTIDECVAEDKPNVILLSSVLQYIEDPVDLIKNLTATKISSLIIDRTPFSNTDIDKLLVQKVPASIYLASYPMWVFSQSKFLQMIASNWCCITEYQNTEGIVNSANGFQFSFQGMLLDLQS